MSQSIGVPPLRSVKNELRFGDHLVNGGMHLTYPPEHVLAGLGDVPESQRPLVATLWGDPPLGRAGARLPDGGRIGWRNGQWQLPPGRAVTVRSMLAACTSPR